MTQTQTDLRIFDANNNEIPFPDGSSAFPTMTLNPIGESINFARTTSGKLVNLVDPAFEYYEVELSAAWNELPAIESMRIGQEFAIWSTIVLKERGVEPSRPAVAGSIVLEAGWVSYRPIFSVKLTDKRQSETEGRDASWTLVFEEIDGVVGGGTPPPLPDQLVELTGGDLVYDYTDADGAKWRVHECLGTTALTCLSPEGGAGAGSAR